MPRIASRLEAARRALLDEDAGAASPPVPVAHDPHGARFGAYIGSMVYGGLDGIVTTFAVVSGVAGADLGANVILILGIGNLIADGFSMGTGDYLSTKSEREFFDEQARRREWAIASAPDQQRAELRRLYLENGYTAAEADELVAVKTRTTQRWVKAMMVEELGLVREEASPLYNAIATFLSFQVAGSLPLLVYLVGLTRPIAPDTAFGISIALSAFALFALGAAKYFVTRRNPLRSGLEMLLVGGGAAAVAYVIGDALQNVGR